MVATLCAFLANCTKCFHAEYFRCEMENAKKLIALHRPESSFCVRCCCCHICWKLLRAVDNFVFITRQTKTNGNRNDEEKKKKNFSLFSYYILLPYLIFMRSPSYIAFDHFRSSPNCVCVLVLLAFLRTGKRKCLHAIANIPFVYMTLLYVLSLGLERCCKMQNHC